jgi:hypothetical protein
MKNSPFNTLLTGVLAASLVLSIYFSWLYFVRTKEIILIQAQLARYQQSHQVLNLLVNDTAEYSRRDPAGFAPIFETLGLKVNRPAAAGAGAGAAGTTAKPAAK